MGHVGITQSKKKHVPCLVPPNKTYWRTDQAAAPLKELKFFNLGSVASSEELARKVKDSIGVSNGLRTGGKDR